MTLTVKTISAEWLAWPCSCALVQALGKEFGSGPQGVKGRVVELSLMMCTLNISWDQSYKVMAFVFEFDAENTL